jgi:hypothetical protein
MERIKKNTFFSTHEMFLWNNKINSINCYRETILYIAGNHDIHCVPKERLVGNANNYNIRSIGTVRRHNKITSFQNQKHQTFLWNEQKKILFFLPTKCSSGTKIYFNKPY